MQWGNVERNFSTEEVLKSGKFVSGVLDIATMGYITKMMNLSNADAWRNKTFLARMLKV